MFTPQSFASINIGHLSSHTAAYLLKDHACKARKECSAVSCSCEKLNERSMLCLYRHLRTQFVIESEKVSCCLKFGVPKLPQGCESFDVVDL